MVVVDDKRWQLNDAQLSIKSRILAAGTVSIVTTIGSANIFYSSRQTILSLDYGTRKIRPAASTPENLAGGTGKRAGGGRGS
jgi:hypothetical protein